MDELRCRLIRDDGSEWRVRRLIREGAGLRVDAERVNGSGGAPPGTDGGSPSAPDGDGRAAAGSESGGSGSTNGGAAANGHLSGEPLGRGDRIEWTAADGRVVWAMRVPLAAGQGPERGHGVRPRPGAA